MKGEGGRVKPEKPTIEYARPGLPVRPNRTWLWVAGIFCYGTIGFVIVLSLLPDKSRSISPRVQCGSNLRQIAMACVMYANENGGRFPDSLDQVLRTQEITADVFVCPTTKDV